MIGAAFTQAFFVGIGGIGMSALALYLKHRGLTVAGYDKTPSDIIRTLEQSGIEVSFNDNLTALPMAMQAAAANTLVIFTPAVPRDSELLAYFSAHNYERVKRAQALGLLVAEGQTLAVAGTHGKTTTSTLLAHILTTAKVDFTGILGGVSSNYNTNLLLGGHKRFVVEADEFDRSFLQLFPEMAVVTSMDPDHLDIYGAAEHMAEAYNDFAAQVKPGGLLVYKHGMPLRLPAGVTAISYGEGGDVQAKNVRVEAHKYYFDYVGATVIEHMICGLPGIHNVENAVAAITIALAQGVAVEHIRAGVASFKGVKRRFEYCVDRADCVYIDDYAHHPTEINALLASIRQLYPGRKVLGVFQPHLFSRTRDFAAGFAESLSQLDELLLLDIYPARELPIPGITSSWLLNQITAPAKALVQKSELLDTLSKKRFDVLLTIGAGDIDRFIRPITELMLHKSPVR